MVFVLSSDSQPLDPCHPARARQLLRRGRARVVRRFPMTIQLLDRRADQSKATGLPLEAGTGGRTKYNRTRQVWPKTHWQDAACVGASTPARLRIVTPTVLQITATGRGLQSRTKLNTYGFPRLRLLRQKRFFGFQTGDMVEARVPSGIKQGCYIGRVAVRASGSFNITTATGTVQGLHHRFVRVLQRADGYRYAVVRLLHPASPAESRPQPHSSHR